MDEQGVTDATTDMTLAQERAAVPVMRAILTRPGNFQSYMEKLWQAAHEEINKADALVTGRTDAVEELQGRLARLAEPDDDPLDDDGTQYLLTQNQLRASRNLLTRALKSQKRAVAFRDALGAGYVPLPRLPAVKLRWVEEVMPGDVLDALDEAKRAGVFEEFRLVTGQDASQYGWPTSTKAAGRDPILVGMVGNELFAVAWWR